MRLKRVLVAFAAGSLLLAASPILASPAAADPPTFTVTVGPISILGQEGLCAFPVDITGTQDVRMTTFYDRNGEVRGVLLTGPINVSVANSLTGKAVTANISGPGKIDTAGTLTGSGPWLLFFFGDQTSSPFLLLVTGHLTVAPNGDLLSADGRIVDLCAALA
jgi:hypothetical protein